MSHRRLGCVCLVLNNCALGASLLSYASSPGRFPRLCSLLGAPKAPRCLVKATLFFFFFFFFLGESPLHIRVHAKANLGGPNAVYQEEALARRQGIWCSVRHERSQEPVGNRRWGQRKVNVNATGRGPKLTARRLGGDKLRTGPGDVHPGLGIGRAARRLRNNCSGRHERN